MKSDIMTDTIEIPLKADVKEEDMFEEIKLYGTLIKVVKFQTRNTDFSYNSYLSYDHINKKYYLLLLGHNHRFIAVSQNLVDMESLLHDSKALLQSEEEIGLAISKAQSMFDFAFRFLDLLNTIQAHRFKLPWRWNRWSNLYL